MNVHRGEALLQTRPYNNNTWSLQDSDYPARSQFTTLTYIFPLRAVNLSRQQFLAPFPFSPSRARMGKASRSHLKLDGRKFDSQAFLPVSARLPTAQNPFK